MKSLRKLFRSFDPLRLYPIVASSKVGPVGSFDSSREITPFPSRQVYGNFRPLALPFPGTRSPVSRENTFSISFFSFSVYEIVTVASAERKRPRERKVRGKKGRKIMKNRLLDISGKIASTAYRFFRASCGYDGHDL